MSYCFAYLLCLCYCLNTCYPDLDFEILIDRISILYLVYQEILANQKSRVVSVLYLAAHTVIFFTFILVLYLASIPSPQVFLFEILGWR